MSDRGSYRAIRTVLIDGPDFQALTPEAKLVFLLLKLKLGPAGIDVLNAIPHAIAEASGYHVKAVGMALAELKAAGWIEHERNVSWIVDGLKHEPSRSLKNENHRAEIERHLNSLPHLPIVDRFRAHYGFTARGVVTVPTDTIPHTIPHTIDNGIPHHRRQKTEEQKTERTSKAMSAPKEKAAPTPHGNGEVTTPDNRWQFPKLKATPVEAEVLDHYVQVHPKRRPGEKDLRAVRRALIEEYQPQELMRAIDGNAADPWHHEKHKHELTYVLRDNGKIDGFIARAEKPKDDPHRFSDENGLLTAEGEHLARTGRTFAADGVS